MKISKIKFSLLSILMPLTIILGVGGYFASISWLDYMNDLNLQQDMEKIEVLQSLENSIYKEMICISKMSGDVENLQDECKDVRANTDSIISNLSDKFTSETISQKINSLFNSTENNSSKEEEKDMLEETNDNNDFFQEENIKNIIDDIRYSIDNTEDIKLVMLLDGQYYNQIIKPIHTYFNKLDTDIEKGDKEYMDFYSYINKLNNNSMIETIFGSYFISTNKSFTSHELTSWDKYMSLSVMPEEKLYAHLSHINNDIVNLVEVDSTYNIIDKLDKMRIDILLGNSLGEYTITADSWISINNKKQMILNSVSDITFLYLSQKFRENLTKHEIILFASLLIILISLILFVFTVKKSLNRIKEEEEALRVMIEEIDVLTSKSRKEVFTDAENILQDFSDKKQIYAYISSILKLLHEKELQAEEASTAKDLFLANMSHEIRTPLNGIVGFTQLLKESSLTPDQQEFITIIENSSDNLLAIVSDILDLSKISANKMELESISFDIFEKVESAVETFVAKADEKRIELGVFIDPAIPQYLISDPTKLSQVLINLISNAIKFTPTDGNINLITEYISDNEDSVTIRFAVKDSGIGVNEEQRTKIFQAFTQADSSTSREFGGTGLGLTISYTIIQYMGGELDVASVPNEGAEFFFTIKLQKDKSAKEMVYPKYEALTVGLALPEKLTDRQVDKNLKVYVETLNAKFNIYSYDELLNGNQATILPDILFIDHSYAKKAQEINMFRKLKTHIILMTTGSLKRIIDAQNHNFLTIIHKPMTINKTTRLIEEFDSGEIATVENNDDMLATDQFQHINALVAEDNLINQKLILVTLEKFGVEVTLASNGQEAFEHRKNEVYDIIFMDIQMPVMNGMEATKAIIDYEVENNLDHIPIIALTANALKGDREKYIESGMDGYASKPLNLQEIKKIIGDYFPNDEDKDEDKIEKEDIKDIEEVEDNQEEYTEDEDEYEEYDDEEEDEEEIVIEKEYDILLYNEMSLQSQVYSRIFKGLGFDVEIAEDEDTFLEKIESGIYIYALYDSTCFDNMPCMVADVARDSDTVPLVFVNEEPEKDFCADTLDRNLDSDSLKEKLENAS